jgi:hypothetical protein
VARDDVAGWLAGAHDPDSPVTARKFAIVIAHGGGRFSLSGIGGPPTGRLGDRLYAVDDHARCAAGYPHLAPHDDCGCGFWACWDDDALRSSLACNLRGGDWAIANVEVFGRTVLCDRGVRAERQRVLSIAFDEQCFGCGQPAKVLAAAAVNTALVPRCQDCADNMPGTAIRVRCVDLAGALGTEVSLRPLPEAVKLVGRRSPERNITFASAAVAGAVIVIIVAAWLSSLLGGGRSVTAAGFDSSDVTPLVVDRLVAAESAADLLGGVSVNGVDVSLVPIVVSGEDGERNLAGVVAARPETFGTRCTLYTPEPPPRTGILGGRQNVVQERGWHVLEVSSGTDGCNDAIRSIEEVFGRYDATLAVPGSPDVSGDGDEAPEPVATGPVTDGD